MDTQTNVQDNGDGTTTYTYSDGSTQTVDSYSGAVISSTGPNNSSSSSTSSGTTTVYPDPGSVTGYSDSNGNPVTQDGQPVTFKADPSGNGAGTWVTGDGTVIKQTSAYTPGAADSTTTTDKNGNLVTTDAKTGNITTTDAATGKVTVTDSSGNPINSSQVSISQLSKALASGDPNAGKLAAAFLAQSAGSITGLAALSTLFGSNTPKTAAYQGSIPTLTALRSQVNAGVPAGQGQQYFTDTTYVDPTNAAAVAAAKAANSSQSDAIIAAAQQLATKNAAATAPVATTAMPWVNQTAYGNTPVTQGNNAGLPAVINSSNQGYNTVPKTGIGTPAPTSTFTGPTTVSPTPTPTPTPTATSTSTSTAKPATTPTATPLTAEQIAAQKYIASLQNPNATAVSNFQASPTSIISQQIANAVNQAQAVNPATANKTLASLMDQWGVSAQEMATATGFTPAEITNLYNQAKGITTATAATTPVTTIQQQLSNTAAALNSGDKSGIAGLNNLIAANPGLTATQIQAMFPTVNLSSYFNQGVVAPGSSTYKYTPPEATTTATPSNTGGMTFAETIAAARAANAASANTATTDNTAAGINSLAASPVVTTAAAPAAPATPTYTPYTQQQMSDYVTQNNINVADPVALAQAEAATNADPNAVNSWIAQSAADTSYATGGLMDLHYAQGGNTPMQPRYLQGTTDGMADKIPSSIDGIQPAKLSHGEFVVPADVVSHLGNGNSDAGAKRLYQMMSKIRMARTGNPKQGKEINPDKFMLGGPAYATGGAVAFKDGGVLGFADSTAAVPTATTPSSTSSGTSSPSLGYSTVNALSPWAGDYVTNMLAQGQALANAPMPAYTGQLTAGPSDLQNQQFAGLQALASTGAPPVQFTNAYNAPAAYDPLQASTQSFTNSSVPPLPTLANPSETSLVSQAASGQPFSQATGSSALPATGNQSIASQYMNPYLQSSLAPQLDALTYQAQQDQQSMLGNLTKQGGFGGSRQAVAQGVAQGNLLTSQAGLIGTGYNTAYTNAMNQFNADQARQLQAQQANIGQQQFGATQAMNAAQQNATFDQAAQQNQQSANMASANFGLNSLAALGAAGNTQQGLAQAADTAALNQYNQQQQYPYAQLQFQQSLLSNLPIATQSVVPNTSTLSNIANAGSGLSTLYNTLTNLPTTTSSSSGSTSSTSSGLTP